MSKSVVVVGAFDDLRSRHLRFLQEAGKMGELTVLLWPDETIQAVFGVGPKFPLAERFYLLSAVRYVHRVVLLPTPAASTSAAQDRLTSRPPLAVIEDIHPDIWVDPEGETNPAHQDFCRRLNLEYRVLGAEQLKGFPEPLPRHPTGSKKVVVTGCYDWLHSGHVRFFEEVSTHGDLYVVVGHDANIRLLKGPGHPLLPQAERRFQVGSIRFVTAALISSGQGWLDAEPELQRLKPNIYAVNEEGDRGGKREYCAQHGIEYLVLKRTPAPGLPPRTSTALRGF